MSVIRIVVALFSWLVSTIACAAPVVVGNIVEVGALAGSGSASVVVPSDATVAIAFFHHYRSSPDILESLTLDGASFNVNQLEQGANSLSGVGVGVLEFPTTGTVDLSWSWSDGVDRSYGGMIAIVFLKGVVSVNSGDIVLLQGASYDDLSGSVLNEPEDFVLGFATTESGDDAMMDTNGGEVLLSPWTYNYESATVVHVGSGLSGSSPLGMSGEYYSVLAGITMLTDGVPPVPGGATTVGPWGWLMLGSLLASFWLLFGGVRG